MNMDTANWERIKEILADAMDRDRDQRDAFVQEACGEDPSILEEVRSLLAAHDRAETRDALVSPFGETNAVDPRIGTVLGPYRIESLLGHGGMGSVYRARRDDGQFEQQVAIKMVRVGSTPEELRRFREERRILARLEHPNIARLLGGEVTSDGQPYLVMELVEGEPITTYCNRHRLSTDDRLRLFRTVCDAVTVAHQNLIVHRDLKPTNILVSEDGSVKLLDFGIARLVETDALADATLTRTGLRAMTPEYASPEQIRGRSISTVSDVYSLGVLLYELLTGHRPYHLSRLSPGEVERVVCDTDPARPSTVVRRVQENTTPDGEITRITPQRVGEERSTDPGRLGRRLAGDLDTIVLTALQKDPARRYASVEALSEDLRRHLSGLPVSARGDSTAYRVGKFIQRNRVGVVVALLFVIGSVVGVVAVTRQARIAERRFEDGRTLAHAMLQDLHESLRDLPGSTASRRVLVTNALEYLDKVAEDTGDDPGLLADLAGGYETLADLQGSPIAESLGDMAGAMASYEKAISLRREILDRNPEDPQSIHDLGVAEGGYALIVTYVGDNVEAVALARQALERLEPLRGGEFGDPLMHRMETIRSQLGWYLAWEGDTDAAQESLEVAVPRLEDVAGRMREDIGMQLDAWRAICYLGDVHVFDWDPELSVQTFESALAWIARLQETHPDHPRVLHSRRITLRKLADTYKWTDRPQDAGAAYDEALTISRRLARMDSENQGAQRGLALLMDAKGGFLSDQGETEEGLALTLEALEIRQRLYTEDPLNFSDGNVLAITHFHAAETYTELERFDEAVEHCHAAMDIREGLHRRNPSLMYAGNLAQVYALMGRIYRARAATGSMAGPGAEESRVEALRWYDRAFAVFDTLATSEVINYYESDLVNYREERAGVEAALGAP